MLDLFFKEIKSWNVKLLPAQKEKFALYIEELIERNKTINLVGFKEKDEIIANLLLESSALIKYINFNSKDKILDIGTGSGFPGIPLKILRGYLDITLLDSSKKKIQFLKYIDEKLNLGLEIVCSRSEELARDINYREKFHYALAKAVAPLPVLIELGIPFLETGGILVCLKGRKIFDEVKQSENALNVLNSKVKEVFDVQYSYFPQKDFKLALIEKIKSTPLNYPRRAGIPSKKPL